jgi:hypothetical protein
VIVCLYEDRPKNLIAVKLAVLSIAKHCPHLAVLVVCPGASREFQDWLGRFSNVELRQQRVPHAGWNVKPAVLRLALDRGHRSALWLDTDVMLAGPLPQVIVESDERTFVAAEEGARNARFAAGRAATERREGRDWTDRTEHWGLIPGRRLPWINGGVLRATTHHLDLLDTWSDLLRDEVYLEAQSLSFPPRPIRLYADQDVLAALLVSTRFSSIPVALIRRGVEIAQIGGGGGAPGYTPSERVRTLARRAGAPPLLHGISGTRPWEPRLPPARGAKPRIGAYRHALNVELSPYTAVARRYRGELGEEAPWLDATSRIGRTLVRVTRNHPVLQGLPLAVAESRPRTLRALRRR